MARTSLGHRVQGSKGKGVNRSARVSIQMTPEMKADIIKMALEEGRTLSGQVIYLITKGVRLWKLPQQQTKVDLDNFN